MQLKKKASRRFSINNYWTEGKQKLQFRKWTKCTKPHIYQEKSNLITIFNVEKTFDKIPRKVIWKV